MFPEGIIKSEMNLCKLQPTLYVGRNLGINIRQTFKILFSPTDFLVLRSTTLATNMLKLEEVLLPRTVVVNLFKFGLKAKLLIECPREVMSKLA